MNTTQRLEAAQHSAQFAVTDLQAALKSSGAVQGMAILGLIERAAALARDIEALRAAVAQDEDDLTRKVTARVDRALSQLPA